MEFRETLSANTELGDDEFIAIILSIGKSIKTSSEIKRTSRKDFDKLFFWGDSNTPIKSTRCRETFEYIRFAPSASNGQTWRVVIDDETAHFHIKRNPKFEEYGLPYAVQWLDIGIALSRYMIASNKTEIFIYKPGIEMPSEVSDYVISVK